MSKYNLDKFYTKDNIVDLCLSHINLSNYNTIIEPSAGNGSFSNKIDCIAYDIDPNNDNIIKQDFLSLDYSEFKSPILIIGNPPFG